jgi:hypothetical protein
MNDPDRPIHLPRVGEHAEIIGTFPVWPGHDRNCPVCGAVMEPRYVNSTDADTLIGWLCLNRRCEHFRPRRPMKRA